MESLKKALYSEMKKYAVKSFFGDDVYFAVDDDRQVYIVMSIGDEDGERVVDTYLVARLSDDRIIIERDMNDKPLVDALVQAGVPRDKIVLAYAGEKIPDIPKG